MKQWLCLCLKIMIMMITTLFFFSLCLHNMNTGVLVVLLWSFHVVTGPSGCLLESPICDKLKYKKRCSEVPFCSWSVVLKLIIFFFLQGPETISDYAVSFHYVPPQEMRKMEFFLYHLRPYGISSGLQDLNKHQRKSDMEQTNSQILQRLWKVILVVSTCLW